MMDRGIIVLATILVLLLAQSCPTASAKELLQPPQDHQTEEDTYEVATSSDSSYTDAIDLDEVYPNENSGRQEGGDDVYILDNSSEVILNQEFDDTNSAETSVSGGYPMAGDEDRSGLFSSAPPIKHSEALSAEGGKEIDQVANETPELPDDEAPKQDLAVKHGAWDRGGGAPEPPKIIGPKLGQTDNQILQIVGIAGRGQRVKVYVNGVLKAEVEVGPDNSYVVEVELEEGTNTVELSTATATGESERVSYGSVTYAHEGEEDSLQIPEGGALPGMWALTAVLTAIGCVVITATALNVKKKMRESPLL